MTKKKCSPPPTNCCQDRGKSSWRWAVWAILTLVAVAIVIGGIFCVFARELAPAWAATFVVAYWVGVLSGQAKDIALKAERPKRGNPLKIAWKVLWEANTRDKHGPAFLFRALEWGALALAGTVVSILIASSGTELTIPKGTELTLTAEIEVTSPHGGEIPLPEGTKLTLPTEIEVTVPSGIKVIVPTATPSQ